MPTPRQLPWETYEEGLGEDWSVFTATLRSEGVQSAFKLAGAAQPGAGEAFRGHVAALLQRWLSGSAIGGTDQEAFKVLVATAPGRRPRFVVFARPMPEDCQRVPEVELVQRVLHDVFDIEAGPAVVLASYVVDLLEDVDSGRRFQLSGPAVRDPRAADRIVDRFLQYLIRRRPEDFGIEHEHQLRMSYLSNDEVGMVFPQRPSPVEQATVDRLPNLWEAASTDLRARLGAE